MADPTPSHDNVNNIATGGGHYLELLENLIDIFERSFMTDEAAAAGVNEHMPIITEPVNPQEVNIDTLPALFVHCEGNFDEQKALGRSASLGKKQSFHIYKNYAVTITYIYAGHNDIESSKVLLRVGAFLDSVIDSNQNANDIANGGAEFIETTFPNKILLVNGRPTPVKMYERKIIYKRSMRTLTSTR